MKTHRISEKNEEPEHRLYEAISLIETPEEAGKFFQDLCTPAEIQAMADRWLAVDLIKKNKSYRQIYEETGVSVTTVGRVARFIMFGASGYDLIYERMQKRNYERKAKIKSRHTKKRTSK
jgi:TrpR-related protein YerC/YecD